MRLVPAGAAAVDALRQQTGEGEGGKRRRAPRLAAHRGPGLRQPGPGGLRGGGGREGVGAGGDGPRRGAGGGAAGGRRGDHGASADLLPPPGDPQPGPGGAAEEERGRPPVAGEEPAPGGGGGRRADGGGGPDHRGPVRTRRLPQLQPDHPGPHPEAAPESDPGSTGSPRNRPSLIQHPQIKTHRALVQTPRTPGQ